MSRRCLTVIHIAVNCFFFNNEAKFTVFFKHRVCKLYPDEVGPLLKLKYKRDAEYVLYGYVSVKPG